MSGSITLTASMRSNLTSLRTIASQMNRTQERLATGKKVNSAIDNASSFYQARSLTNRAADLNALLDSMGQGIQTIQAANTGLEEGLNFMEQASIIVMSAAEKIASAQDIVIIRDLDLSFHDFWDGQSNTQKIVAKLDEMGVENYAAKVCTEYYAISADDENFGKGNWYLPSEGELMDVYGYDYGAITSWLGTEGATPTDGKTKINAALEAIGSAKASKLSGGPYWSSSEEAMRYSCLVNMGNGYRHSDGKNNYTNSVRAFLFLENKFDNTTENKIDIGNIVYSDFSYSTAEDYDSSKDAVGVVTWISDSGASAKIMSLKDLGKRKWGDESSDIPGLKNYGNQTEMLNIFHGISDGSIAKATGTTEKVAIGTTADLEPEKEQFNIILSEYDSLIDDTSYQGINLLNGGNLTLTFNEGRTNNYTVNGADMSSLGMGIEAADWKTMSDVQASIEQLTAAINQIRNMISVLGTSYQIIQTRQSFTEAMTDILETGADNLVLADMNEESANYLSLQVRNNLAINSLSLASQSAQSVLKLF